MKNLKRLRDSIDIVNTCENNLKNLSLSIPKNVFTLVTGLSGSGKSTLINDLIAAEASRRYLEQLNPRIRTLYAGLRRPDVEHISGLSPVVSVDQISASHQIRSTVGTLSGLYDYLRLLFARYAQSEIFPEKQLSRSHFSFNLDEGQCQDCHGIGEEEFIDPETFIIAPHKSIRDGALSLTTPTGYVIYSQVTIDVLSDVCQAEGFSVDTPWNELTRQQRNVIFYGSEAVQVPFGKHTLESRMKWTGITAKPREEGYFKGVLTIMEDILRRDRNKNILKYTRSKPCQSCNGKRLNQNALSYKWSHKDIADWAGMAITELQNNLQRISSQFQTWEDGERKVVAAIAAQCQMIVTLGLGHLSINRSASTLSNGERKRLKISSVLEPGMMGLIYTIDEPTIGLHPGDHKKLLKRLQMLSLSGNTVLCIDHKLHGFAFADHWIEVGPDAGKYGGEIIVNDNLDKLLKTRQVSDRSKTWPYLNGEKTVCREIRAVDHSTGFNIEPITANNLKSICPRFFQERFNIICGVSGAGKSTLLDGISKQELFNDIIHVNQKPIGRTPRSNPLTYTKIFDKVRNLFAQCEESKKMGLTKSHFSFNVKGGRCETCQGAGKILVGVSYLGKIETDCPACMGKRFGQNVLSIRYQGKNISEVLDMDVDEAGSFFESHPLIRRGISLLEELGLGYIKLGQSSNTLSGGEAQRIKLVAELLRGKRSKTLYLLDEPTNGLHYDDIQTLLPGFDNLLDQGHTIIAIEHDPYLISVSDWVVELGPGAGDYGGKLVFEGTVAELSKANTLMSEAIHDSSRLDFTRESQRNDATVNDEMVLEGVSTNNLKDISVRIPARQITAISGLSGSGKSSLAFDTLYQLSKFLYSRSFSSYIQALTGNQFEGQVKYYQNILPAIGINYKEQVRNDFSTIGTLLGLYQKIRLLFSRFALDKNGKTSNLWARHFSYQDTSGACVNCEGHGYIKTTDELHVIGDPERSIANGAMSQTRPGLFFSDPNGQYYATFLSMCRSMNINPDLPWQMYNDAQKEVILYGTGDQQLDVIWEFYQKKRKGSHRFKAPWKGFISLVLEDYEKKKQSTRKQAFESLLYEKDCPVCDGMRLKPERQQYKLGEKSIGEWGTLPISGLSELLNCLKSDLKESAYPYEVQNLMTDSIDELMVSVNWMIKLDLEYLHLLRRSDSLSSGEYQRVRMISQLANGLSGLLYVMDEPSAALGDKNIEQIVQLMRYLQLDGNTIVFTDHHPKIIELAQNRIALGPGAGKYGGSVVTSGDRWSIGLKKDLTRSVLFNPKKILLVLQHVYFRNLKIEELSIPQGWISISGVSGSGKSSLLNGIIYPQLIRSQHHVVHLGEGSRQWSWRNSPIQKLGLLDPIARAFGRTSQAKSLSFKAEHFKPGNKKTSCKRCQGRGQITDSLDFLGESKRVCKDCNGTGFERDVLSVKFKGLSISQFLSQELGELSDLMMDMLNMDQLVQAINCLGISYLKADQSGQTLSIGERQRILLARILHQTDGIPTVFLMDEPTRGLDIQSKNGFIQQVYSLLSKGHHFITIDHDSEIIEMADWNIRLGPGAGQDGGQVVYRGLPE